ncbi:MAG: glycine hydroxymethyltransferase [Defluviitaleaceae bacterium]|nr:glycine hydroxymethyltransferase [Defluviitaleaceae bacterium]
MSLLKYLNETPKENLNISTIAFFANLEKVKEISPSIAKNILNELQDQRKNLKLIASENFSSLSVQSAMGNLLTDKYAEGYPYNRFYAGCDNVDKIEEEAANLAQELFGADYAYVQPHSGADANMVAFLSILMAKIQKPFLEELETDLINLTAEDFLKLREKYGKQKLLAMDLYSGGHLTHGYRFNNSAIMFDAYNYTVDKETKLLDIDNLRKMAHEIKPLIFLVGYSAYSRKINFAKMREIADEVGAVLMVDMAHFAGLVAGGVFTGEYNPVPYAHVVTTTTHKTLRGPRGGMVLCKKEFKEYVEKGCPSFLGGPLPHVMAAKALAFKEALSDDFKKYAHNIVKNSQALADSLMEKGVHIVTGGTDNHLLLVDVSKSYGLTGRQAENAVREGGITLNRNGLPFDINGPWYTSGLRLGTPAVTSLGMGVDEMKEIASIIDNILKNTKPAKTSSGKASKAKFETDLNIIKSSKKQVADLLLKFPLYPEIQID